MPPINANSGCPPQTGPNLTAAEIEQAFCNALQNCMPQPLEVTADSVLTALLESIADDIIAQLIATGDDLANSLEDITVTIDTSGGPVEVTGTVSISGDVTVDWSGIQDALNGLEIEVTNYQDLVDILTDPATTLTIDGSVTALIDPTQFAIIEDLLGTINDTLKAIVRKDWEVIDFCIVDADGVPVPLVGVFSERGYDYLGNQVSEIVVYSKFDPTVPEWTSYALQAGDQVVECSRQTTNTVLVMEGCYEGADGELYQGYSGINSIDGTLAWGPLDKGDLGFVACCPKKATVQACVKMEAFDYYSEKELEAGQTMSFTVNGGAPIVIDYLAIGDGVNKSSWYGPVIAAVNALGPWTMTIDTDAGVGTSQRPVWQIDYNGVGGESLVITQNSDTRTISVDAAGVLTSEALGGTTPFGTDPFTACSGK